MISRLTAVDPEAVTDETKRSLEAVGTVFGMIPNLAKVMALSPVVLHGFAQLLTSLTEGRLGSKLREQIALAVAEANGCQYCVSAHTAIGAEVGLDEVTMNNARQAVGSDPKSDAALRFVRAIVDYRGELTDEEFLAIQLAGYSDEAIAEILGLVCANLMTNYFSKVAKVEIDFPIAGMPISAPHRRGVDPTW